MNQPIFFTAGYSAALQHAHNQLLQWGYGVSSVCTGQETHLLLPVPSFEKPGILKGSCSFVDVLAQLPANVTILGGNLPELPCPSVDFLQDEHYLVENAAITARCTMKLLQLQRPGSLSGANILVIGWGRIGKQLAPLLQAEGAILSVAARRQSDLDALTPLGCRPVVTGQWSPRQYDVIINTAPALLLDESEASPHALLIDLASVRGISGERVLWARGLPSKDAPVESGILIAKTALRYALGKEIL